MYTHPTAYCRARVYTIIIGFKKWRTFTFRKLIFPHGKRTLKTNDGSLLFIIGALLLLSLLPRISYEIAYQLRLRFECMTNSFRLCSLILKQGHGASRINVKTNWRPLADLHICTTFSEHAVWRCILDVKYSIKYLIINLIV